LRHYITILLVCFATLLSASVTASADQLKIISGNTEHVFEVEIANTPALRAQGLMFRTEMAENAGMLFDFGRLLQVNMWMKNTILSLDMLFADASGSIITIARETEPQSTRIISSGGKVKYVLEIGAGIAEKLGLAVGDRLVHPLIKLN
jgi:hypothetical protein